MTAKAAPEPRYIPRTLSYTDSEGERQMVDETELLKRTEPLVILGEPGMGKSVLLKQLGLSDGAFAITARAFLRIPDPTSLLGKRQTLVIDALDEVAAAKDPDPVQDVLAHLVLAGRPRFILSCRVSDWLGAPVRSDIEDTYAAKPLQLNLEPFSEADALCFLGDGLGSHRAQQVLAHYSEKGLSELFGNPQTLHLIADASRGAGSLPETRADLLDKACQQMALEHNERHGQKVDAETLLDAAGAMSAMLILSAKDAVSARAGANVAATDLALAELTRLPHAAAAEHALGSRLFVAAAGDRRFTYVHRTVAEYLAALWLGRQVECAKRPQLLTRRLIELIRFAGGVPASLRGVHSWLAKFSVTLASEVITADPIGVLRYGDPDGLTAEQGRAMLEALDGLVQRDSNFRAGDWSFMRAKGLVQPALEADIKARITSSAVPFELRTLLLECLAGSEQAARLHSELCAIMLNSMLTFGERRRAADCLEDLPNDATDWLAMITALAGLKDAHSTRLAVELMVRLRNEPFDGECYASVVLANSGILLTAEERKRLHFADSRYNGDLNRLRRRVPDAFVMPVLDNMAAVLLPQRSDNEWHKPELFSARGEIAGFAIHLIRRQLEMGGASPRQLFEWLNSMERGRDSNDEDRGAIAARFEGDDALRRAVQKYVLLDLKPAHAFWDWTRRLAQLSYGLRFSEDDVLLLLQEVVARDDPADRKRWESLVLSLREKGRVPKAVQKLARPFAKDDAELLEILATKPGRQKMDEVERNWRRADSARQKRREASLKRSRDNHEAHIAEIELGEFQWIINPAYSYLGQCSDIDSALSPHDRIASWLGEEVALAARKGFDAALHRNDRPSFPVIVERYVKGQRWNDVYPILAGAALRFVTGTGFANLDDDVIASLAMIEDDVMNVADEAFKGFSDSIELELRSRHAFYENYLRNRYEPYLANRNSHITGLHRLTRSTSEQPLSAQLSLEWLARYTDLPLEIERNMAECIIHSPQFESAGMAQLLLQIVQQRLARGYLPPEQPKAKAGKAKSQITVTPVDPDPEQPRREWEGYWTALLFLLDFEAATARMPVIDASNRDWLWFLTNFYFDRHGARNTTPSPDIPRLIWIVETFRHLWRYVEHPRSSQGSRNEWDATERVESAVFRLAANAAPEAAEALQRLLGAPEDGYTDGIKTAMARQHQARVEASFRPLNQSEIVATITDGAPQTVDDVLAIVCDELDQLQAKIRRSNTNMVQLFYENGQPKGENDCRDTMLNLLQAELPHGITWAPELSMQGQDRADCGFAYGTLRLPVEAKGQWHRELWSAAETQLFDRYAQDWQAQGRGLYLVFWFGGRKKLQRPPKGVSKIPPATPVELAEMLTSSLPPHIRPRIIVWVLDLQA